MLVINRYLILSPCSSLTDKRLLSDCFASKARGDGGRTREETENSDENRRRERKRERETDREREREAVIYIQHAKKKKIIF